jgi:hypothetical protein
MSVMRGPGEGEGRARRVDERRMVRAPSGARRMWARLATRARYDNFILMANAAKIACSIDAGLLKRVETVRARTGESRSAFISRALLALTAESARAGAAKRYVEAYKAHPEGQADVVAARRTAARALSGVDWDDA